VKSTRNEDTSLTTCRYMVSLRIQGKACPFVGVLLALIKGRNMTRRTAAGRAKTGGPDSVTPQAQFCVHAIDILGPHN